MKFSQKDERRVFELEKDLEIVKTAVHNAKSIFPNKKVMYAYLEKKLEGYTLEYARTKTDVVDNLGLSWRKVAELYSVPINAVETISEHIFDGMFTNAIKWDDDKNQLVLDEEIAKQIIDDESDIKLNKKQADFVKQVAKMEKEYKKLYDYTQSPEQMIRLNYRTKEWEPSVSHIKYFLK